VSSAGQPPLERIDLRGWDNANHHDPRHTGPRGRRLHLEDARSRGGTVLTEVNRVSHPRRIVERGSRESTRGDVAPGHHVPGVRSGTEAGGQIADPAHPCQGAVPREHSHFFTADGEFGSLDWNGEQVDDDTYVIIDDRTFVIGNSTFHYQVRGDTIMFEPVIPDDCSTKKCRDAASWSVAVAYPGEEWARVG
jgi:hypothetical protein